MLIGVTVMPGYAIGHARVIKKHIETASIPLKEAEVTKELELYDHALDLTRKQLDKTYEAARQNLSDEEAEIFAVHRAFLDEQEIDRGIREHISRQKMQAPDAISSVLSNYTRLFDSIDDDYLKARKADLLEVYDILTNSFRKIKYDSPVSDKHRNSSCILVTQELMASDLLNTGSEYIKGIIAERGNDTAHSSIVCRSLGIPYVYGVENAVERIKEDDLIVLDAFKGIAYIAPEESIIKEYTALLEEHDTQLERLQRLAGVPAQTSEGIPLKLCGNAASIEEVGNTVKNGGEGVGLFRTEFLFMQNNQIPTEQEQYQIYSNAAKILEGRCLTIRTLDVGGDKNIPYLGLQKEDNAFLGIRGIRYSFEQETLLKSQLRAVLRASIHGNIRIMFPMVSAIEEIYKLKELLNGVKNELKSEAIPFDEDIKFGVMIEVPSLAVIADLVLKEVDFASIGTNDLTQYIMAADRTNSKLRYLTHDCSPALVRLIRFILREGEGQNKDISICGEMAGVTKYVPLLIGLGLKNFSTAGSLLLPVKAAMRRNSMDFCISVAEQVLKCNTSAEIEKLLCPQGKNTLEGK